MASDRGRSIGVLVVVAIVLLVVARFVIRSDDKVEEAQPSTSTGTSASASHSASPSPSARHARYESALVDASIRALSSGAGTALAVGDDGAIFRHKLGDAKWSRMESRTK